VFCFLSVASCHKAAPASDNAAQPKIEASVFARAEDRRHAKDLPADALVSHDIETRRKNVRALARIADAASVAGLRLQLADEDEQTVAWAAYGLGYTCKGNEEAHVQRLVARSVNLHSTRTRINTRGAAEVDPKTSVARALGRCGGPLAERTLAAWIVRDDGWRVPALLGLGDLASRHKSLARETLNALTRAAGANDSDAAIAFYALSRAEPNDGAWKAILDAGRATVARGPNDARILAIKTLGRSPEAFATEAAATLQRVVLDATKFSPAERAEAARGLGALLGPGREATAKALGQLTPDKDGRAIAFMLANDFHVVSTLIASLGASPPKSAEAALEALATMSLPTAPSSGQKRRLADLRCGAAVALARGAYDTELLTGCAAEDTAAFQNARLMAILRRPLKGERATAFRALARNAALRVREAAVAALAQHPEFGAGAAPLLAEALASNRSGLVATAADVIHSHPERALAEEPSAAQAAERILPEVVASALGVALAHTFPNDHFETQMALVDAAAAVRHPQALASATRACRSANGTVRERARKALRTLGDTSATCDAPDKGLEPPAPPFSDAPTHVQFAFDGIESPLTITLETEFSAMTTARLTALVESGFYKGITVHRVVPGFVVQFGDPDGDGYGGSGVPLRCETSPVSFAALDVGMALAGRDTGGSQLFVTLARTPHLDGEYTRVGFAEGAWQTLVEGDIIVDAHLFLPRLK
jgi:cyclophilin family peptidyl-prolyl cis-trans isomerase